ncbi:conserved hypothetical protein [gamma proteobacterium NOR5-3]|nr:conserved hypothetical protein [gamma proteobacterium NOR5-3]
MIATPAVAQTTAKPARVLSTLIKRAAIVESVNADTRELKLLDAQGNRFTVVADERVRNFSQIKPRDRIVAEYLESVAVVIAPKGSKPPVEDGSAWNVAEAGDKPGVAGVETRLVVATVQAINAVDRLLTLETEDGDVRTVKVSDQAELHLVDIGDQVRLRITTAIAMRVVAPD